MAPYAPTPQGTPEFITSGQKFGAGALAGAGALRYPVGLATEMLGPIQNTPEPQDLAKPFTVDAWFSILANTDMRVIAGYQGAFFLAVDGGGRLQANIGGGGIQNGNEFQLIHPAVSVNDGFWHHAAIVYEVTRASLYLDGKRVATREFSTPPRAVRPAAGAWALPIVGGFNYDAAYQFGGGGFGGKVDEVRFSNVARYLGAEYIVYAASYPSDAHTLALFGLDADGSDRHETPSLQRPYIGPISVTSDATTDTISFPAPELIAGYESGRIILTETTAPPTAASLATHTAVINYTSAQPGTFQRPRATSGTKYYTVRVYGPTGGDGSDPSNVVSSAAQADSGYLEVLPSNDGILFSPYNWDVTDARALTPCAGAYFRTMVEDATGVELRFDVSSMPANATQILYRVNGGAWVAAAVAAGVTVAFPAPASGVTWKRNLLEVLVKSSTEGANRWASPYATAVKLTALRLQRPAGAPAPKLLLPQRRSLQLLVIGDSITEGINTLSASGDTTARSSALYSYAYLLGEALGAEVGVVGFGRLGVVVGGNGSVPAAPTSWDLIAADLPRPLDRPTPDLVIVNLGTNDKNNNVTPAAFHSAYVGMVGDMLSSLPEKSRVLLMRPFGGHYGLSAYQDVAAAVADPRRVGVIDTTGWWQTSEAPDGVHPFGWIAEQKLSGLLAGAVRPHLARADRTYINVGGNPVPA